MQIENFFWLKLDLKSIKAGLKQLAVFILTGFLLLNISACVGKKKPKDEGFKPSVIEYSNAKLLSPANGVELNSTDTLELKFDKPLKKTSIITGFGLKKLNGDFIYSTNNYKVEYANRTISFRFIADKLKNTSTSYKISFSSIEDAEGKKLNIPELEFNVKDTFAPEFLKSNLTNKRLNSAKSLLLTFSEDLQNASGIKLQKKSGANYVYVNASKYDITFAKKSGKDNKSLLELKLTDENLKKTTGAYKILFEDVKDLAGNNLTTTIPLEFEFLESVAPKVLSNNLGTATGTDATYKLSANSVIEFVFSESLSATSISTNSLKLQNSNGAYIDTSKYKVELDSQNPNKIKIYLLDYQLKNQTQTYTLTLTNAIKDLNANSLQTSLGTNSFKINLKDSIRPRFKNSNIFAGNILAETKKIDLVFSEPLADASKAGVTMRKNGAAFTDFSAAFSADKHRIILIFDAQKNEPAQDANYIVDISTSVKDLAENALVNPQKLPFKILKNSQVVFVKPNLENAQAGTSWQDGTHLQDAIDKAFAATPKKLVLVANGSYFADHKKTSKEKSIILKDGVKIYGGFDPTKADAARNLQVSILEAKMSDELVSKILVKGIGLSATSLLDGFLIQNALNREDLSNSSNRNCAGINLNNSSPILSNLTIKNNTADKFGGGGGICNLNNSNPIIKNSLFIKNSATFGGAIYNENSSPSIKTSVFVENFAANGGGAISSNDKSKAKVLSSSFIKNSAQIGGGAIYDANESATSISNITFIENSAMQGGAIMLDSNSTMKVYNSVFWQDKVWWNSSEQKPDVTKKESRPSSIHILDTQSILDLKYSSLNSASLFKGKNIITSVDTTTGAGNANNKTLNPQLEQIDMYFFIPLKTNTKVSNLVNGGSDALYQAVAAKAPSATGELDQAGTKRKAGSSVDIGAFEILE